MRKLIQTTRFKRDLKKFVKRDPALKDTIRKTLEAMLLDPYTPFLKTHKLDGKHIGLLACSCGYDCRIVFKIAPDLTDELIILTAVGTNDDVY